MLQLEYLSGSVLRPAVFGILYVNDMVEGIDNHINMFADDAKLVRKVVEEKDCEELQRDLDGIVGMWSEKWQMQFNVNKCKVMELGKSQHRVKYDYKMQQR